MSDVEHIKRMAEQIRHTTNCDALERMVAEHVKSVLDVIDAAVLRQANLLSEALPLISLPSPDPVSIVKWLGKLILKDVYPDLESAVKYAIQIAQLASAVAEVVAAVAYAAERLAACAILIPAEVTGAVINDLTKNVNVLVDAALSKVVITHTAMAGIVPAIGNVPFDTSSSSSFVASASTTLNSVKTLVVDHINTPITPP